ncbi:Hypothetical protein D9617_23g006070 [Elsinoe fawcettii]|nr:Hypothetical protein D9617_23g006070 [Elsinoe fawcettii]
MQPLQSLLAYGIVLYLTLANCPRVSADINPFFKSEDYMRGVWGNHTRQRYLSNPFAIGPVANVVSRTVSGRSPSKYILYAPYGPLHPPNSPTIIDADTLAMVWYGPSYGAHTIGPTVQSCKGVDYITFWSGKQLYDRPAGNNYIFDSEYNLKYNISTQGHLEVADSHEIFITPECTAIISAFQTRPYNFGPFGPENSWLKDSYFQEIDLATGKLLFEWQASAHVNVSETYWGLQPGEPQPSPLGGFDFFHMNSIAKDRQGNYLISARHTHTIYYISGQDGSVIWRLGGKHGDFEDLSDGRATDFKWQHFARWVNNDPNTISVYDNANAEHHAPSQTTLSRGMVLKLDFEKKTVRLERSYNSTNGINSMREGSMQVLTDSPQPGNALLGYGGDPGWTEYSPNGTVLDDVMFGPVGVNRESADNYRALKVNWTGLPQWPPRIAPGPDVAYRFDAEHSMFEVMLNDETGAARPNTTAYFSWNGATDIDSWVVLASNTTAELDVAKHFWARIPKGGFEDSCFVGEGTKYVLVMAIDAAGHVMARSDTMDMAGYAAGGLGPRTGQARHLEEMTVAWRKYKLSHPASLIGKLRAQWNSNVKIIKARPQISIAVVGILAGVCAPLLFCLARRTLCRGARSGHLRAKMANMVLPRSSVDLAVRDYSDEDDDLEDKSLMSGDSMFSEPSREH